MIVYVCYEMDNDSFCYNVVRKVVADESQAISWAQKGSQTDFGPTKSYEKFEYLKEANNPYKSVIRTYGARSWLLHTEIINKKNLFRNLTKLI